MTGPPGSSPVHNDIAETLWKNVTQMSVILSLLTMDDDRDIAPILQQLSIHEELLVEPNILAYGSLCDT